MRPVKIAFPMNPVGKAQQSTPQVVSEQGEASRPRPPHPPVNTGEREGSAIFAQDLEGDQAEVLQIEGAKASPCRQLGLP